MWRGSHCSFFTMSREHTEKMIRFHLGIPAREWSGRRALYKTRECTFEVASFYHFFHFRERQALCSVLSPQSSVQLHWFDHFVSRDTCLVLSSASWAMTSGHRGDRWHLHSPHSSRAVPPKVCRKWTASPIGKLHTTLGLVSLPRSRFLASWPAKRDSTHMRPNSFNKGCRNDCRLMTSHFASVWTDGRIRD